MNWFRTHIKLGSRLALLALALQFALSFGHFHAAQAAPRPGPADASRSGLQQGLAARCGDEASRKQQPANHDRDQQPADACAICAVISLAGDALFATPPLLLLPQAVDLLYLTTDAEFVHLNSARLAFQSRAPPIS